jgi:hypothetical protein
MMGVRICTLLCLTHAYSQLIKVLPGIAGGSYNPPQAEIPPLQPTTSTLPASMVFVDGMWMDPVGRFATI